MKKILFFILFIFLFNVNSFSFADEQKPNTTIEEKIDGAKKEDNNLKESKKNTNGLRFNFKKLALDISNTQVQNSKEYKDSTITELNANDEMVMKGVLDFAIEYEQPKYRWDNKINSAYGKTTVETPEGEKTKSENADEIIFTTDFTSKFWKYKKTDIGPFVSAAYQTEYTAKDDTPKNKVARGQLGIRLINGKYISNLYLSNIFESDFTYDKKIYKYGVELGTTIEHEFKKDVKFKLEGYYRKYISYNLYNPNDLEYDLNLNANMSVKITKVLSIVPFISLRQAHARGSIDRARNITTGISIVYSQLFKI